MKQVARFYDRCRYLLGRLRGAYWSALIRLGGGQCGKGLWVGQGVIWKYAPHAGIQFGNNVQFGEYCILDVPHDGELHLADFVKFSMGCVIAAKEMIQVGQDSQFGEYCSLRDADHGMALKTPIRLQTLISNAVVIGTDVWVGRGVAVLRGAHIADGAVIGAIAVVRKGHLPDRGIFVGSPCRLVKMRA